MGDSAARLAEMRRLGGRRPGLMAAGALGVVVASGMQVTDDETNR